MPQSLSKSSVETSNKARVILGAARSVFFDHGFFLATTDMIQRLAGVSKSTMYYYFPNKEALFIAVIEVECDAIANAIEQSMDHSSEPSERLAELGRRYLRLAASRQTTSLYRAIISEARRFPELALYFYTCGPKRAMDLMTAQIEHCLTDGVMNAKGSSAAIIARHFIEMLRGDAQMRILTGKTDELRPEEIERIVKEAVSVLVDAYGVSR